MNMLKIGADHRRRWPCVAHEFQGTLSGAVVAGEGGGGGGVGGKES